MDPASAARATGLPPGTQLGRYTLLRRFAIGGMAELYLAHQRGAEGFAKLVALKRILPHLAAEPQFTRMFLDEARLAATLQHPNIAQVLDFGEHDGEHYLTMEYVHGRHLLDVLRAHGGKALPLPVALGIVSDVARALHHVHEQRGHDGRPLGLVHRDVSPSNVLISYEGAVKLTDFGIAKAMELTSATRTGTFKGKLGYAAPEQCRGEPIDRRADIFALGILLYETTTGARAFSGPNEFAVLGRVARGDYVPPLEVDPEYPAWLAPVIARALALDPAQRPPTAGALADELDELAYATFERGSPTRTAAMMHGSFGETPPVTSVAELSLVGARVPATTAVIRRPRRALPWLGAVAMATLLVGAWAWGRAAAQAEARPLPQPEALAPAVVPAASTAAIAPTASAPLVVPAPVIVAAPSEPAIAEPPPPAAPVAKSERKPSRKPKKTRSQAQPQAGLEDLYPPGHPR
ncbi:MAG TPA: serine/threonine-protein kinase [Nannocystaceae bacterium]|nr:serine/threonine-protein kinase [Nannocystaceae bacterium]